MHYFFQVGLYQKKETRKISEKNTIHLYIVPGAPTLFYQQGNQNSCIISSFESVFHSMGNEYASKYIIKRMQKSLLEIRNKGWMHFCRDIIMGHHREKNEKIPNYHIDEWHTSTPYDILWKKYTYPTVCFLLDTWQRTDHCITVFGKWVFGSNLKMTLPPHRIP